MPLALGRLREGGRFEPGVMRGPVIADEGSVLRSRGGMPDTCSKNQPRQAVQGLFERRGCTPSWAARPNV